MNLKSPLDVQVEVTSNCNHNCDFCYNTFEHEPIDISSSQMRGILEDLVANKVFSIILTGGEPFLNRKVLVEGLKFLYEKGVDTYVNSNLSIPLTWEEIDLLKTSKGILFSFHSANSDRFRASAGANTYNKVLKNIEVLSSRGIKLSANQVVTQRNINDVYETGKFLFQNFEVKNFSATPVNPSGKSRVQYKLPTSAYSKIGSDLIRLEQDYGLRVKMLTCVPLCIFSEELRDHESLQTGCSAGVSTAAIGVNGGVRKCTPLAKEYGNIFQERFKDIWQRIIPDKQEPYSTCKDCPAEMGCSRGCEQRVNANHGIDPLVRLPINPLPIKEIPALIEGRSYKIKHSKNREEAPGEYIIVVDGSIRVFGNESLVRFLRKMEGGEFKLEEVRPTLKEEGVGLIKYLNYVGMVEAT